MSCSRSCLLFACQAVALPRLVLFLALVLELDARAEVPLAQATIVIYNTALPDSAELAKFYAQQRGIATDHVIGLLCSVEEEISREQYDEKIATPLREIFRDRHWWVSHKTADGKEAVTASTIHFVALCKGIPLKIRGTTEPYPGDKPGAGPVFNRNEASVDSELATLAVSSPQISGPAQNPYFKSFRAIGEFTDAIQLLVCRLDGPSTAAVRRMIVDSIAAEKNGLWGRAYVDGAHNTMAGKDEGDKWLAEICEQLHKEGVPVVYDDSPAIFPDGYPMTDCALYYGWYNENVAGPFNQPGFRFVQGAVAVHIHSFSATTLRDVNSGWVGPLVARGAAASMGNVYEPYLQMTAHLDLFNDRLLHGFTLAESAYASLPALSWMSVVVGDPLYRPYASWLQLDAPRDSIRADNWRAYHEFAAKYYPNSSKQYRSLARQTAARTRNCPMLEDLGLMEAHEGNFPAATSYFSQARACYSARDDILRVVLEEAEGWARQNKPKRALDLVRSVLRIAGDAPAAPMLRQIEHDLSTQPAAQKP
jgi:uncharacterized protein (TIGR03790 family)